MSWRASFFCTTTTHILSPRNLNNYGYCRPEEESWGRWKDDCVVQCTFRKVQAAPRPCRTSPRPPPPAKPVPAPPVLPVPAVPPNTPVLPTPPVASGGDRAEDDAVDEERDDDAQQLTVEEKEYALQHILHNHGALLGGRSFKTKAYKSCATALKRKYPNRPMWSCDKIRNVLVYIKGRYDAYEHARSVSGMGWDEAKQHVVADQDKQERYLEQHGKSKAFVFKTTFHFFRVCDQLFGGNKATGEHAFNPAHDALDDNTQLSPSRPASAKRSKSIPETINVDSDDDDDDELPSPHRLPVGKGMYADELLPKQAKDTASKVKRGKENVKAGEKEKEKAKRTKEKESKKRKRAESEEDEDEDEVVVKRSSSARERSGAGAGPVARRNAEAGTQMASGLLAVAQGLSAPVITKQDTSHVDDINKLIANEPTLLPKSLRYYGAVMAKLTNDANAARAIVTAATLDHKRALLALIFTDAGLPIPVGYLPDDDDDMFL
ncbi:hypothetical protein MKEN_00743100 [Mycena kentingensis (nom. inval.)]|nr:hypothetical protein MKEN_00743100 [Mycena kentingensis (nom. inval.)]